MSMLEKLCWRAPETTEVVIKILSNFGIKERRASFRLLFHKHNVLILLIILTALIFNINKPFYN